MAAKERGNFPLYLNIFAFDEVMSPIPEVISKFVWPPGTLEIDTEPTRSSPGIGGGVFSTHSFYRGGSSEQRFNEASVYLDTLARPSKFSSNVLLHHEDEYHKTRNARAYLTVFNGFTDTGVGSNPTELDETRLLQEKLSTLRRCDLLLFLTNLDDGNLEDPMLSGNPATALSLALRDRETVKEYFPPDRPLPVLGLVSVGSFGSSNARAKPMDNSKLGRVREEFNTFLPHLQHLEVIPHQGSRYATLTYDADSDAFRSALSGLFLRVLTKKYGKF